MRTSWNPHKAEMQKARRRLDPLRREKQSRKDMIERCRRATNRLYHRYGGRGIVVCERWLASFWNFLADMGGCPPGHTLDRKDNDGNYEPGNCRWATTKEQAVNKCVTRFLTFRGETLPTSVWAERLGIPRGVLYYRVGKRSWPVERALTTPLISREDRGRLGLRARRGMA